jgi:hypothetical protein
MIEGTSASPEQAATSKRRAAGPIISRVAYAALAAGVVIVVVIVLVVIVRHSSGALRAIDLATNIDRHGPAVLGIPAAAVLALFLVSLARALDGQMTLEFFGVKSDGASATCIIWIALFLAISLSLRALW